MINSTRRWVHSQRCCGQIAGAPVSALSGPQPAAMDAIPLGPSYTWLQARRLGVTRGQISADGIELSRGLDLSSAVEPDLEVRCHAWAKVLPADAAFGFRTAAVLHGVSDSESASV